MVSSATLLGDAVASVSATPFESSATRLDLISSIVSKTWFYGVSGVSVGYGLIPSAILENSYSLFCSHRMHS